MTLNDWLKATGKTRAELAQAIGTREHTICRYINGNRYPRPEIIARIKAATGGAVTADDLISGARELSPSS